jgi:hypothetical protein
MPTRVAGEGVSLVILVLALRHLGTTRRSASFSVAPIFGGALSHILWPEIPSMLFWAGRGAGGYRNLASYPRAA